MLLFVKQNKQCLSNALDNKPSLDETEVSSLEIVSKTFGNNLTRKVAIALRTMVEKSQDNEKHFNSKLEEKAKEQQRQAYEMEAKRNDLMKQKLLDEYEKRLLSKNVQNTEREALLAELHAKMSHINDLTAQEQQNQNQNLNNLLQRRRQKKQKL